MNGDDHRAFKCLAFGIQAFQFGGQEIQLVVYKGIVTSLRGDDSSTGIQNVAVQPDDWDEGRIQSEIDRGLVITPSDLEETYGLTGGHPYHGEISLDQIFTMRPLLGSARYRTPIRGLYLCGSGTHPGNGLTGASGFNAAREILKDLR
jgi:phytoene dehydrogenase-like protein